MDRIVIADRPSLWRNQLASALKAPTRAVRFIDSGEVLLRELTQGELAGAELVLGEDLQNLGGLDALYLAASELASRAGRQVPLPVAALLLVTMVRYDEQLLALWRRRGVAGFLYRDEPLDRSVRAILASLENNQRVAARIPVSLDVRLTIDDETLSGTIDNLSEGGAKIVIPLQGKRRMPFVGLAVTLKLSKPELSCQAEIRWAEFTNRYLQSKLLVGVQFSAPSPSWLAHVKGVLEQTSKELGVVYGG